MDSSRFGGYFSRASLMLKVSGVSATILLTKPMIWVSGAYRARVFAALLGAAAALAVEESVEQQVRLVEFFGDVRVGVEAVDARRRVERHAVDEAEVLVVGVEVGHVVLVERGVELVVVVVRQVSLVVVLEQHLDESAVFVVGDSAAVVALGRQVLERLERQLVGVLVDEDAQLRGRDAQVRLCELVGDVPAERAVFLGELGVLCALG